MADVGVVGGDGGGDDSGGDGGGSSGDGGGGLVVSYDAIPKHEVTLQTPYLLHPNWNTDGHFL